MKSSQDVLRTNSSGHRCKRNSGSGRSFVANKAPDYKHKPLSAYYGGSSDGAVKNLHPSIHFFLSDLQLTEYRYPHNATKGCLGRETIRYLAANSTICKYAKALALLDH